MIEVTYFLRVGALFGMFAVHASNLAMLAKDSPDVLVKFHAIALFMIIISLCVLLFGHYIDITLALCDSALFGFTVGVMLISTTINSLDREGFMIAYIIFLITLLSADIFIVFERKFIYHDIVTDAAVPMPEIRVSPAVASTARSSSCAASLAVCTSSGSLDVTDSGASGDIELGPIINPSSIPVVKYPYVCSDSTMRNSFKIDFSKLPPLIENGEQITTDYNWDDFHSPIHVVDSSSCHIYRALSKENKEVILKLIKLDRISSPLAMSEFEAEGCILARVRHPHIIRLLGCGSNPRPFLVLEVLEGGTLSNSLGLRPESTTDIALAAKRNFTYIETLTIAISLASALDYLHNMWNESMHVIHRDLKPDNIGWTQEGYIKIFDFGLCSCVRTDRNDMSESYQLTGNTGTLRYMAPEVALGKPYNYTVDVYSFSIIIWQICQGKVPFSNLGKKSFLAKVVRDGLRPPLDPIWPDKFKLLLEMCWHADKNKRPNFTIVLAELEALLVEAQERKKNRICWGIPECVTFLYSLVPIIRRLRPLAVIAALALLIAGCTELSPENIHAGRIAGSCAIVFASSLLYLLAISYWKTIVRLWLSRRQAFGAIERHSSPGIHTPPVGSKKKTLSNVNNNEIAFNPISSSGVE